MEIFLSIFLGITIILLSLFLIKREVKNISFFKNLNISNQTDLVKEIQKLESSLEEINSSFYEIVHDLEGKYSIHEKEIRNIENELMATRNSVNDIYRVLDNKKEVKKEKKNNIRPIEKEETDDFMIELRRLKSLGYDNQTIARRLNKSVREIDILLNIKK